MSRPRSFDAKRAHIAEIAASGPDGGAEELGAYLDDKSSFIVAEAARVVGRLELAGLVPALVATFHRLLVDGAVRDKTCAAKNRVLEALLAVDADVPAVFLAGLAHVQIEPAFPQAIDTAAALRGLCARALVRVHHREALVEVAPLLADPEAVTRVDAAVAIADIGTAAAGAVLHLKARAGDVDPDVIGACYRGLLFIAPGRYVPYVAAGLADDDQARAEVAALALGESRLPAAVDALLAAARGRSGHALDVALLALALSRVEAATRYLLERVDEGRAAEAKSAVIALAAHRHDAELVERVRRAVEARAIPALTAAFDEHLRR